MAFLSDEVVRRLQQAAHWPVFGDGRYSVSSELGRGGMGTVYLARDELLGRDVAIKVAAGHTADDLDTRLRNEARVLARLEHPGIVPVHDAGRLADGRPFYVMKHVHGRTLLEHLGDGLPLTERLRIIERLCEAVAFAHAQGCLHRDLKPQNVMVGRFGEVLLLDWGIATTLGGETPGPEDEDGVIMGTHGFMAPEQAAGTVRVADARADVYGLGAILFTLLTGAPPDPGGVDPAAALASRTDRPRPLRAICARALAPRPDDRYPTVEALADDLARFRGGLAVSAYKERPWERLWRMVVLYRTPLAILLAYLVMRLVVAWLTR